MIRHSTKIAIEMLLGAVVVLAVLALGFVWRLSEGPISLSAFRPQLVEALEDRERGLSVSMVDLVLTWNRAEKRPDLRALGFRIEDEEGVTLVDLPLVSVTLSVGDLLRGEVSVSQIDIIGVVLDLVRREDGSFDLNAARPLDSERSDAKADGSEIDDIILTELMHDPDDREGSPLSALRQIRVIGARMTLTDLASGTVWRAPDAFLTLRRIDRGISADLDLSVALADSTTTIEAQMVFDRDSRQLDSAIEFSGLRPSALYEAIAQPSLMRLRDFDLALSGSIVGQLTTRGRLITAAVDLETGAGSVTIPELQLDRLPLRGMSLGAGLDMLEGRVNLRTFELRMGKEEGGPVIAASGSLSGLSQNIFRPDPDDLVAELSFGLDRLAVPDLARYWPPPLVDGGRAWVVENITAGEARDLSGTLRLEAPDGDLDALALTDLSGGFSYEGLEVHYLRPMPPVKGISGSASFTPESLRLSAEGGELDGIGVSQGSIDITGLQEVDHYITIEHRAQGAVPGILELLDHPRLGLISRLGLSKVGAAGQAEGLLFFRFPLINDLSLEELELRADADLTGAALDQVVLGQDLSQGNMKLAVTLSDMRLSGDGALGGIPASFDWHEYFEPANGLVRQVEGSVPSIDETGIAKLGLDSDPYLRGPVAADFSYEETDNGFSQVGLDLDLERAELSVPVLLDWEKPVGEPGRAALVLEMQDFRPVAIKGLDVKAGSLTLLGEAFFDDAGSAIERAQLSKVTFGDQSLWGVTLLQRASRFEMLAEGGILDLGPFLALDQEASSEQEAPPDEDDSNFRIEVKDLEQVRFAQGRYLEQASLVLERVPDGWLRVRVGGRIPAPLRSDEAAGERIEIDYGPAGEGGGQVLSVTSGDAGGLFRAVNLFDTMQGGALSISARRSDRSWATPLNGSLLIEEFKLVEAPVLARILTLASLTGILNVLGGDGITFQEISGDFSATRGRLSTELMRAFGPAIGLTAEGFIDLDQDQIKLNGTVVPAYSVNRVLGAIPLLGTLLTGGEGEGVFAVTYGISGPVEEPDVSVNPLSVLAPGFLRNLFGVPGEGDDDGKMDTEILKTPQGGKRPE
jgi:hypothetical protein